MAAYFTHGLSSIQEEKDDDLNRFRPSPDDDVFFGGDGALKFLPEESSFRCRQKDSLFNSMRNIFKERLTNSRSVNGVKDNLRKLTGRIKSVRFVNQCEDEIQVSNKIFNPQCGNKERKQNSKESARLCENEKENFDTTTIDEYAICSAVILRDHKLIDKERLFRSQLSALIFELSPTFGWSKTLCFHDKMIGFFHNRIINDINDVEPFIKIYFQKPTK